MDVLELIPHLLSISREAGKAIMAVYQRADVQVQHKDDQSPVTEADVAAHDLIKANLQRLTPDIPLLSEEQQLPEAEQRQRWQRYWLIDPLDGTREFLKRNDEFTVNIALIDAGRPVLGVVHVPVSGSTYVGAPGVAGSPALCAYKQTRQGKQHPLSVRPILGYKALTQLGSRHHQDTLDSWVTERLEKLAPVTLTTMGSSLKLCLIAEGLADVYVRGKPTSEWDTAAAQAVLEAAGGRLMDFHFEALRYNQRSHLTNPSFIAVGDTQRPWQDILAGITGQHPDHQHRQ
ncbi:3'(2'),5'-bisphosphate nucleotidase [Pokkaliibacter plantistimulans]|uniref:3'(2'),5'-bisphosphate nucleotidase CysQ n=1 Tax=Proteobacteria bacterium 228 TaxID=2083153 RepID=A0A2S5KLR8_9PROT|nr:3'(2'),5'-bisphosphate nucleotidase CysQ [Pokkaliibacter plantistimulans]PPC75777.1 3'(2'),5'-bisphosphate nucleotidase [Pokkaliibacter plantistimulans]